MSSDCHEIDEEMQIRLYGRATCKECGAQYPNEPHHDQCISGSTELLYDALIEAKDRIIFLEEELKAKENLIASKDRVIGYGQEIINNLRDTINKGKKYDLGN